MATIDDVRKCLAANTHKDPRQQLNLVKQMVNPRGKPPAPAPAEPKKEDAPEPKKGILRSRKKKAD